MQVRHLMVLVLSFFLYNCQPSTTHKTTGSKTNNSKQDILYLGNGAEPRELDPTKSTGVPEAHIIDNLFEGLTTFDPITLKPLPAMALSWALSNNDITYTFKLRRDAFWSDGKKITAHDFVWSWQRVLAPKTASEYAYQLYYLKNAKQINENKIKDLNQLGVKATDDHTLIVTLENPTPFFLQLTAFHTFYPTPKHMITKYPEQEWTREGLMVSNGPFKLQEWKLNHYIKLVPNEHYWDYKKIKLKAIYFYPTENVDTEEKTFHSGQLHMTSSVPTLKVPLYMKQKSQQAKTYHPYHSNPYLGIYYYRFNTTRKPFNDVKVRRALALTIDRKLIVEKVTKGGQLPAISLTPPNTGGYTYKPSAKPLPITVTFEHIKTAKKLLAAAGYPNGKGFPHVEILYNTNESHKKVALAIQQMWKKHLGIQVKLYNQEWKVYLNSEKKLNFFISRAGWIGDYPDPKTFLDMFVTNRGNNKTGWSNPQYDQLIAKTQEATDNALRFKYFQQAEEILMQQLPIIPIYVYTQQRLVAQKVKMITKEGKLIPWQSNITDRLLLKHYALSP